MTLDKLKIRRDISVVIYVYVFKWTERIPDNILKELEYYLDLSDYYICVDEISIKCIDFDHLKDLIVNNLFLRDNSIIEIGMINEDKIEGSSCYLVYHQGDVKEVPADKRDRFEVLGIKRTYNKYFRKQSDIV